MAMTQLCGRRLPGSSCSQWAQWTRLAAAILLCICAATGLRAGEELKREKEVTRKDIDERIEKFVTAKKAPTMGLLKEIINLSIAWGAPAFDDGDREGCTDFYQASIDAMLKAFEQDERGSPEVRKALADLKTALADSKSYPDIAKRAWALRYGFDKVLIAYGRLANHQQLLVGLGTKYFQLGLYTQAQDAFRDACDGLVEITGIDPTDGNFSGRMAPLAYSRALFSVKKFDAAAKWLATALVYLPDWPTYAMDPVQFYGDEADQAKALHALEAAVADQPDRLEWQNLLAAEYFFMDRKAKARTVFQAVLEKDADNTCAQAFLKTYADSDYQKDLAKTIADLASRDRKLRNAAYAKLQTAGRWAIPALHHAERTASDADIAFAVRELLRRLGETADAPIPRDQEY